VIALKDIQEATRALIAAHATFAATAAARVILDNGKKTKEIAEALREEPGFAIVILAPLEGDLEAQANKLAIVDALLAVSVQVNPTVSELDVLQLGADVKSALTNVTNPIHPENRFTLDEGKPFMIVTDDPGLREYFWFFRRKASL
jgi:hypothetical protein